MQSAYSKYMQTTVRLQCITYLGYICEDGSEWGEATTNLLWIFLITGNIAFVKIKNK